MEPEKAALWRNSRRSALEKVAELREFAAKARKLRSNRTDGLVADPAKDPFASTIDLEAATYELIAKQYEEDLLAAGEPLE